MTDKASDDKPWWKSLPTLDEIRARPWRTLRPDQYAALAEAAAVFLEGGEGDLAAHLEQQRLEKERQDKDRSVQDPNVSSRARLQDLLKRKPDDPTTSIDSEESTTKE
jgi:hypothetical protein